MIVYLFCITFPFFILFFIFSFFVQLFFKFSIQSFHFAPLMLWYRGVKIKFRHIFPIQQPTTVIPYVAAFIVGTVVRLHYIVYVFVRHIEWIFFDRHLVWLTSIAVYCQSMYIVWILTHRRTYALTQGKREGKINSNSNSNTQIK